MAAPRRRSRPPALVARPRLLRALARPWKVAALTAPAGFGKTTLAAQFARGRAFLWCRLVPEDRDPAHLLGSLLVAAARARRPFGARTRRLFEARRDMERDGTLLTASFLDELSRGGRRRLVVLDDAHLLDEAREGLLWLRRLIEDSGPGIRFLLACRAECPLPLARLALAGGTLVLRAADLQFTREEAARLLRGRRGSRAGRPAAGDWLEALHGWPAGVVLAARHLQRPAGEGTRDGERIPAPGPDGGDQVAGALEYLAEEVFAPLPATMRSGLCRASLLDGLDPGALRALLGRAAGEALRAEVERRDLFVERLPDGTVARFHPLFRDFLRARFESGTDPHQRRRLGERLARYWMRRGEAAQAIRALADVGSLDAAVRLFDAAAGGSRAGALGAVALEISRGAPVPAALSPGLLLHGAYQARDARRLDECLRLARAAQVGFLGQGAPLAAARAFGLEAETALSAGRLRDAGRQGAWLRAHLPPRPGAARSAVARHLGTLHLYMGEPARARTLLGEAARHRRGRGQEIEQAEIALAQATVAYTEGHWDVYLQYARRALPVFRRAGYRERAGHTLINMGEACTYLGLEDLALAHFEEAGPLLPRRGGQESPLLLIYRARARSEKGELEAAAREFAAAREPARRHGLGRQELELDVWEGICARRRGRLAEADRRLGRAATAFAGLDAPSWLALARMERALVRGLLGHGPEALRELAGAARVTRRLGDEKELARNALFEARVRQCAGTTWRAPLDRALASLSRLDYLVLLRKEADVSAPLLAAALADRALRARARSALDALPDPLRHRIEHDARAPGATAGDRQARRSRTPAAASGLRVRLLGGFEVRVDDRLVRFPRRAAAALVACLVLRRGVPLRWESLAETLWPGLPARESRNRFDVALNAARHALEPAVPARGPFRLLTTEGGLCRLGPAGLETDLDRFEREARACEPLLAAAAGARGSASSPAARHEARRALSRLAAALDLYGGELLPGLPDAAWAEAERERLRDRHHRLRIGLATLAQALGMAARAEEAARRILADDPLHEEALRALMRALAARGERAAALRACQEFERRLDAELDTTPAPETTALRRQLAGDA